MTTKELTNNVEGSMDEQFRTDNVEKDIEKEVLVEDAPKKRGRGRPKGAKNKEKVVVPKVKKEKVKKPKTVKPVKEKILDEPVKSEVSETPKRKISFDIVKWRRQGRR